MADAALAAKLADAEARVAALEAKLAGGAGGGGEAEGSEREGEGRMGGRARYLLLARSPAHSLTAAAAALPPPPPRTAILLRLPVF